MNAAVILWSGVFMAGPVVARNGMVATSQPLAVDVGVAILKKGGNAVDAAIAVDAVLGVVEPMSCGLGGDLYVLLWDAKTKKLYGLNASGRAPYAATRDFFREKGLDEIPEQGPLSWSVPGCVHGWEALHQRFGSLPIAEILAPAIQTAEKGFVLTPIIGTDWHSSRSLLAKYPELAATFLKDGLAPAPGDTVSNPRLGRSLRQIAEGGAAPFYRGNLAEAIVAYSGKVGGLFSLRDFADDAPTWIEPVSIRYRGYEVWELPPPGQGIAALQILNLLEPMDLASMGHNSAEFLHWFIEAKKLAFADRARFYADPDFSKSLPVAELISKDYAERRRRWIDPQRAAVAVEPGQPRLAVGDTVYLTVVDKDRNAVSFIQSNYFGWGSGVPAGELGFVLQNRGCLFSLDPDHPNTLEPHKRPFHTIIPAMVTKNGRPVLSFGVMGGDMQPQGHAQVLINLFDHHMDVQAAGAAPRVRHNGSATPTGGRMTNGGEVQVERGIPSEVVEALRAKGHVVHRAARAQFGGYQAIRIDEQQGTLEGGSDPRKDGKAAGY